MKELLTGAYDFLEKLFDSAWDIQGYRQIRVEHSNHLVDKDHWVHDFASGYNYSSTLKASANGAAILQNVAFALDEHSRMFVLESMGFRNMCSAFDVLVNSYNDAHGYHEDDENTLPLATEMYKQKLNAKIALANSYWEEWHSWKQPHQIWYQMEKLEAAVKNTSAEDYFAIKIYDWRDGKLIMKTGIGTMVDPYKSIHALLNYYVPNITIELPYGVRCIVKRNDSSITFPETASYIGKTVSFAINKPVSLQFYFDLEFYFSGVKQFSSFTTEKGLNQIPV